MHRIQFANRKQSHTKIINNDKAKSTLTPWATLMSLMMILSTETGQKWGDNRHK